MRKALLFLLLLITPAIAEDSNDSFYIIDDFSSGMKSHVSEYKVDGGTAKTASDIRINEEYGQLAKRPKRFVLANCHASPVKSLYRYYLSDATKHTVATSSTYIDAIDSTGTCTSLYANASDGKRWSFVTYKDLLIGMNGTDNAKKWDGKTQTTADTDGSRTAEDLVTDLGAPFAELNTGSNLDASSWYQYKIAYWDGSIYTYSDARSNPLLTGSTVRDITLTDIPLGPAGTTNRYVYRTVGDASRAAVVADSSFYKVTGINDNTTTTYNDAITDATILGDPAPTWATVSAGYAVTPPKSKYSAINAERLFIANDPSGTDSGKSTVYYSNTLLPDYFYYHTDYELFRPDDGDEITFIKNLLGVLTIGKTRTISKFYTEGATTNWSISDPYSFMGCDAPWSAVNGITGIIYAGRYGIYNFTGQSSELISDVTTDRMRDILETNRDELVGTYNNNTYYLSYTSADSGEAVNNRVLVFDITRNAYVEDSINVDSFSNYDAGDDAGTLYSGSSNTDGSIYAHGESYSRLTYRYLSQVQGGTADSIYMGGEEESPYLMLGSNGTWANLGAGTWASSGSWTWMMHDQTGEWYSPIVQINAATLDKLTWNESLGDSGNVTLAIRTGATSGAVSAASWSSEFSDPSGSDVSGVTANVFVQLRASLSTSSWTESPTVFTSDSFMIKLTYKKSGDSVEPSYLSFWQGGKTTMGQESPKRIKEVQVYYSGTSGTLTTELENESGDSWSFDVNLATDPGASSTDSYFGTDEDKIYVYIPSFDNQALGRTWQFKVSESGTEAWRVKRIVVRVEVMPYITYQGSL